MIDFQTELKKFFKGDIDVSEESLTKYSHDASIFEIRPQVVVYPKDSADIQNLVKWVNDNKQAHPELSITARAAGTCMAGGPLNDSIILDTTRYMNTITKVEKVQPYIIKPFFPGSKEVTISGEAVVAPGVFYRDFEKETLAQKLLLPCFTASKTINAMGGMVGNNSGGELTLRYGKTEDYVKELKMVFSDGYEYTLHTITRRELYQKIAQSDLEGQVYKKIFELIKEHDIEIRAARPQVSKNSAGYNLWNVLHKGQTEDEDTFDLCQLCIGSQGTLGIVTEITFRLVEIKKESELLVVFLSSIDGIGNMVNDALEALPETIEAYDDKTIKLAMKFWYGFIKKRGFWGALKLGLSFLPEFGMLLTGIPKLVLLIQCAGDDRNEIETRIRVLKEKMKKYPNAKSRIVTSKVEAEKYWMIRHDSFALLREHFQGKRTAPFIDDVIVPPNVLPEFFPKIKKILEANNLLYNMHGHAANGNFHIIPLLDTSTTLDADLILRVSDEVYDLVLSYHGSIDAEHNDGIIRTPYLVKMYGEQIVGLFKEVKDSFDPKNIFNPKKKVGGTKEDIKRYIAKPDAPHITHGS